MAVKCIHFSADVCLANLKEFTSHENSVQEIPRKILLNWHIKVKT